MSTDETQVTNTGENQVVASVATESAEAPIAFPSELKIDLAKGTYLKTIGRRKTSTAQVRLFDASGKEHSVTVNGKEMKEYFPTEALQRVVMQPLTKSKYPETFEITVVVRGGGASGQAQAVRHGVARALAEYDPATRTTLKKLGYLKRDPRSKERKKPGLKKARKASQWSKR